MTYHLITLSPLVSCSGQAASRVPKVARGKVAPEYATVDEQDGVMKATFPDGVVWSIGSTVDGPDAEHRPRGPGAAGKSVVVWSGTKGDEQLEAKITNKLDDKWLTLWNHGIKTKSGNSTALLQLRGYPTQEWGNKVIAELGQKYIDGWDKPKLEAHKKMKLKEVGPMAVAKRPAAASPVAVAKRPAAASDVSGGVPAGAPVGSGKTDVKRGQVDKTHAVEHGETDKTVIEDHSQSAATPGRAPEPQRHMSIPSPPPAPSFCW